jgi:hypothetical protein
MTELQSKVIEFIKSSPNRGKRYLTEFEDIIEVKNNLRYQHSIRAGILGRMVTAGLIKKKMEGRNRNHIYYYV